MWYELGKIALLMVFSGGLFAVSAYIADHDWRWEVYGYEEEERH